MLIDAIFAPRGERAALEAAATMSRLDPPAGARAQREIGASRPGANVASGAVESLVADIAEADADGPPTPFTTAVAGPPAVAAEELPCLLDLPSERVGWRLSALDWDFHDRRGAELTHDLHPYPAKFVSHLARQAIATLSRRGDLVLDPFSGGGTTGVEAVAAGRSFVGIDANPVGNVVGTAKTAALRPADVRALLQLEADVLAMRRRDLATRAAAWVPDIPNRPKWYADDVFQALGIVRERLMRVGAPRARALALVAFVQAAARLSFQESETRYKSRPRPIEILDVPRTVLAELRRMRQVVERLPHQLDASARFVDGDAREPGSYDIEASSAGLIVTSPPYPNAYDYHLYHRFRLFWLGHDPRELRRVEIGSHLANQALKDPVGRYLDDLRPVLEHCHTALAEGRWAVFVVGDGLFEGRIFETAVELARLAEQVGFDHVVTIDRSLPQHRRSVTHMGRRLATEQIVVLRRPSGRRVARVQDPNYGLLPYERELQVRELRALGASPASTAGEILVTPRSAHARAAFVHGIVLEDGRTVPSAQGLLERGTTQDTRRKNSTYAAHGIHRYKGKFYPQLAKSLLNLSGLTPGDALVVDPFGGSGTLALEAAINGFDAVSIDRNPVAVAIARAKLASVVAEPERLNARAATLRKAIAAAPSTGSGALTQFSAACLPELERWFPGPVLRKLDCVLRLVRHGAEPDLIGFFEVLASDIVRDVSQQEPRDLRIRRRASPLADAPVYELYLQRLDAAMRGLAAFWRVRPRIGPPGSAAAVLGDSATDAPYAPLHGRPVDAAISSPPYAAALPYVDTDRLSLAAIFGISSDERKAIEQTMIGSREITERERAAHDETIEQLSDAQLPASTRGFLADYRAAVAADDTAGFRRRQAPAVLLRYFLGMSAVFDKLRPRMAAGAPCWLVLGDSRSTVGGRTWTIPTVDEVATIAEHRGFRLRDRIPITVTRENVVHARNAITRNEILRLQT